MLHTAEMLNSEAEFAIGARDASADWLLKPHEHAASLPAEAGPLKRLLQRPEVQRIMDRYTDLDQQAIDHQTAFRSGQRWMVRLAFAAFAFGVIALTVPLVLGSVGTDLQVVLVVLHVIAIFLMLWQSRWLQRNGPKLKWRTRRGEAELMRQAFFRTVCRDKTETAQPGEIPVLPLQLAYLRRYLLDDQIAFFSKRSKEFEEDEKRADWLRRPSWILALLALVVTAMLVAEIMAEHGQPQAAMVVDVLPPNMLKWIITIGICGLAVSTYYAVIVVAARESENSRNAIRYASMASSLSWLKNEQYERVRLAAENGEQGTVHTFIDAVLERLMSELQEWVTYDAIATDRDNLMSLGATPALQKLLKDRMASAE